MDKIFNKPFAINGTRVAIPENGTENERVSFDKGFTQPYEVEAPSIDNPNGQGFNILRPEMNEALYQLSSACNFLAENIDKWTALTTENLNNITQKGRYFQATQSQATNANNYPTNEPGYLIVFDSINNNVTQFYKSATTSKTFYRYKIGSAWGNWVENLTTENAYKKSEALKTPTSGWKDLPNVVFNTTINNPSARTIMAVFSLMIGANTSTEGEVSLFVNDFKISAEYYNKGHHYVTRPYTITAIIPPNGTFRIYTQDSSENRIQMARYIEL